MKVLEPGYLFADRYRIEGILGKGGFSVVYAATQLGMERPVALKLMSPTDKNVQSMSDKDKAHQTFERRFEHEAQILSRLTSNATVSVYDFGTAEDGTLFMALEYIDGVTLDRLQLPLQPDRLVHMLKQALESLKEAHHLGVLHRDIKPQNIMVFEHLGDPDSIKLLDFGIAKLHEQEHNKETEQLTQAGMIIGTPRYMAPETLKQETQLPASDIYAMGLICYELATGTRAIDADSSIAVIAKQISDDSLVVPMDLQLPEGLKAIINKMMAKSLDVRYSNCQQIMDDLEHALKAHQTMELIAIEPLEALDPLPGTPNTQPSAVPPEMANAPMVFDQPPADTSSGNRKKMLVPIVLILCVCLVGVGIVLSQKKNQLPVTTKQTDVNTDKVQPKTSSPIAKEIPKTKPDTKIKAVDKVNSENTDNTKVADSKLVDKKVTDDTNTEKQDPTSDTPQKTTITDKDEAVPGTKNTTIAKTTKKKRPSKVDKKKPVKFKETPTKFKENPSDDGTPTKIIKKVDGPIF